MVDNYWSDYIGNGSYVIDQNNVDSHPLTQQVEISSTSTPKSIQPSADLTLPIAVTVVVLAVAIALLLNRRLKTSSLKQ